MTNAPIKLNIVLKIKAVNLREVDRLAWKGMEFKSDYFWRRKVTGR